MIDDHTRERISRELYRAIDCMATAELSISLNERGKIRELRRARNAADRARRALEVLLDEHIARLLDPPPDINEGDEPTENPAALPGDADYTPIVHNLAAWLQTPEGSPND